MQENAAKQTQSGGSSIRRSAPRKKKKNQVPFGFLGLLLIAVIDRKSTRLNSSH